MERYKYIFVILVYRNSDDLEECLESIRSKVVSYKVIVVNAYYDNDSRDKIESIANRCDCDFINIENKGYSYGNNTGITLALEKYEFDYIVVSNPDIVIEAFDDTLLCGEFLYDIIAPQIIASKGRAQNPMLFKENRWLAKIVYHGFKRKIPFLVYLGILISKALRSFQLIMSKIQKRHIFQIHQAHGSFVLLNKRTIEILTPVYDENMFLFAEEIVLAAKAKKANLKVCYYDHIKIRHKEDGSMKLSSMMLNEVLRESNIYCYEHYLR